MEVAPNHPDPHFCGFELLCSFRASDPRPFDEKRSSPTAKSHNFDGSVFFSVRILDESMMGEMPKSLIFGASIKKKTHHV